jgi:hypothetical protein
MRRDSPDDGEDDTGKDCRQLESQVSSERLGDEKGDGTDVVGRSHTYHGSRDSGHESKDTGETGEVRIVSKLSTTATGARKEQDSPRRQLRVVVPSIQIVASQRSTLSPENEMLLRDNHDERSDPVREDREEVRQDLAEMFATCDAGYHEDKGDEDRPEESRDALEGTAEGLDG